MFCFSCVAMLTSHTAEISNALYVDDYHKIVSSSLDKTAKLWDTRQMKCCNTFKAHSDEVLKLFRYCSLLLQNCLDSRFRLRSDK